MTGNPHVPVRIEFGLGSPLLSRSRIPLDGLIHNVLEAAREAHDGATPSWLPDVVPLSRVDGEPYEASEAIIALDAHVGEKTVFGRFDPHREGTDHDAFAKHVKVNNSSGKFRASRTTYPMVVTDRVTWVCRGDIDAIRAVMDTVDALGARRMAGFGEVVSRSVTPLDLDVARVGWTDGERMLRPVPVSVMSDPPAGSVSNWETWFPPYADRSGATACWAPVTFLVEAVEEQRVVRRPPRRSAVAA